MDRPSSLKASDWFVVMATTALLFVSFSAVAIWITWDDINKNFRNNQPVIHATLSQRLNNLDAALVSLVGQIHTNTNAPERISSFAQAVVQQFGYLQTVMIAQQVSGESRPVYEDIKRQSGLSQFTLKQMNDKSLLTNVSERDLYYPVDIIEPVTPANIRLTGLDLRSLPVLDLLINEAISTGRISSSRALYFMGDTRPSYFIAKVIYSNGYAVDPTSVSNQDIAGLALLQIDSSKLLPELDNDPHYQLSLYRPNDEQAVLEIHSNNQSALLPPTAVSQKLAAHDQNWRYTLSYQLSLDDFANRNLALATGLALLLSVGFGVSYRIIKISKLRHQHTSNLLFEQREKARVALESIHDAVIITNLQGQIDFINPAAETLLGQPARLVLWKTFAQSYTLVSEEDHNTSRDPVQLCLHSDTGHYLSDSDVLLLQNGNAVSLHTSAAAIHDAQGDISGVVLVLRDISHSRRQAKKMSYEAMHDQLTGLINRRGFEESLGEALDNFRLNGSQHVMCYLDLDEFKPVNDACGHRAGDELLKLISSNIKTHIRRNDVLARLGGDEFGLLLNDCPMSHAGEIAEKIREEVRNTKFYWNEKLFSVGVSIGMAAINDQMHGIAEVINAADTACYMAKDNGRNQVCILQPDVSTPDNSTSLWPERIRKALSNNQFMLLTQVIVPLTPGNAPPMLEFLIRLKTSAGRLAPPKAFLPAAERYEMMYDIDLWVINQAMGEISRQKKIGTPILYTINLSAQSLEHEDLGRVIEQSIARHQIKASQLCFETSETSIISHHERALHLIKHLRGLGCYFAIDNFGAGLSSLSYLKKLPIDFIKIDGSLIRNICNDMVDKSMVRTISHIGHVLNVQIVAEWVEDEATLAMLNELGVDYAQGFHISKPDDELVRPLIKAH
ncbi:MAG: EAL domain-containing protein [Gammaproteobacteria bacterium]|nr:EAL domain-containing protein [Gammaproteobacteria bacterium]